MTPASPSLVLIAAHAWRGTPYVPQGALCGAGADCVGFVRGVIRDVSGRYIAAPVWDADGASRPAAVAAAAARHLIRLDAPQPGAVVVYRIGRRAHVGIACCGGRILHCDQKGGVIRTPAGLGREIVSAWAIPV